MSCGVNLGRVELITNQNAPPKHYFNHSGGGPRWGLPGVSLIQCLPCINYNSFSQSSLPNAATGCLPEGNSFDGGDRYQCVAFISPRGHACCAGPRHENRWESGLSSMQKIHPAYQFTMIKHTSLEWYRALKRSKGLNVGFTI